MKLIPALLISIAILTTGLAIDINPPSKGIAMAYPSLTDIEAVSADWYYYYGTCSEPNCVPMSWCGEDVNLSPDYMGYILLFNEPENPAQCNITPEVGLSRYEILLAKYPNAKWVVGNSIFWGTWNDWLYSFRDLCTAQDVPLPYAWGVHIYVYSSPEKNMPFIQQEMGQLHQDFSQPFWVTEFAEVKGNVFMDDAMVRYFQSQPWIERYAYFTNRAQGDEAWYPYGWKVQLSDYATGELTAIGKWYRDGLHRTFLGMVIKN